MQALDRLMLLYSKSKVDEWQVFGKSENHFRFGNERIVKVEWL